MDFKKLLSVVTMLLLQPAMTWKAISHEHEKTRMLNNFLYPMLMLCCLATFLGAIFDHEFSLDGFYMAIVKMGVKFITLFFAYYLSAFVVSKLPKLLLNTECDSLKTEHLTGYSMVVFLALDILIALFPNFRIIAWILQFYTVKVVWDGVAVLLRVGEEQRLTITMVVSLLVITVPFVVGLIMSALSANLG